MFFNSHCTICLNIPRFSRNLSQFRKYNNFGIQCNITFRTLKSRSVWYSLANWNTALCIKRFSGICTILKQWPRVLGTCWELLIHNFQSRFSNNQYHFWIRIGLIQRQDDYFSILSLIVQGDSQFAQTSLASDLFFQIHRLSTILL